MISSLIPASIAGVTRNVLMNPTKVVMHVMERNSVVQIFQRQRSDKDWH
jgi:hypothetical protein